MKTALITGASQGIGAATADKPVQHSPNRNSEGVKHACAMLL